MKKVIAFLSYVLVAAAATVVTMFLMTEKTAVPAEKPAAPAEESYDKLDQLRQLIDTCFIGEADMEKMEDAAAAAMVEAMGDRWSHYMTAEEFAAYKEQMANAYVGVGVTVSVAEDGYIDVLKVEAGGPALEAGMKPGDVIVAVEGQDIQGRSLEEIKEQIRGEENTKVNLTVRRDEEILELSVTRRQIQVIVAQGEMLEDNIGYVQIVNFDDRCAEETLAIVKKLLKQGAESLVFDVRYNPGGYKNELVQILDYLLPEGPLFRSVLYTGAESVDNSNAACLDIPMAVLINGDSYSAAEFFAAALSEYDAAILVGQPTTGKGYFQSAYELDDGSAVSISIGKYTTPKGVSLADVGLTPDITVDVDAELYMEIYYGNVAPMEDPQIQAAIKALKAG